MFSPSSRYASIPTDTYKPEGTANDRTIIYARRRFLPQGKDLPLLAAVRIKNGDRLDLVTAAALGDPEQFWQIGDANNAMNPHALVTEPGKRLHVPLPQA